LLLNVNDLGDEGATILASALQQNRTLAELGLASNGITQLGAATIFTALAEHRALQKLDLGYSPSTKVLSAKPNFIGDEGAREVAQFLRRNTTLQQLDLRHTGITSVGIEALLVGLRKNQTLTRLWLDSKQDVRIARILAANQQLRPSTDLSLPSDVAKIRSVYRTIK
jgi:Ran GTPase-activating protein (RanGAP) involved in mRNA processing and transport